MAFQPSLRSFSPALVQLVVGTAFLVISPPAKSGPDFSIFDYDKKSPLAAEQKVVSELADLTLSEISFAGGKGSRASGYLVRPRKSGKGPAVIFMHELGASRTEFLSEAMALARMGAVALLLDAPWNKPPPSRRAFDPGKAGNDRDLQLEAIGDARRAIDYLTGEGGVSGGSLAFVGHSYGANWGSILAAVEDRIKVFVLIAGVPSVTEALREERGPMGGAAYLESIRPLDPDIYLPEIRNKELFLQFGTYDLAVPAEAGRKFTELAAGRKQIAWYECGHEMLDNRALKDRTDFLKSRLRLSPPSKSTSPK